MGTKANNEGWGGETKLAIISPPLLFHGQKIMEELQERQIMGQGEPLLTREEKRMRENCR